MRRSSAEGYPVFRWLANLVTRHYKLFVILWVLAFFGAVAANQVWRITEAISYDQAASLPRDTPSAVAQRIIDEEFPGRVANSTAVLVLVAEDVTEPAYRHLVADLHEAIVASSRLRPGESVILRLYVGVDLTLDRPIEYLGDPGNATIYAVYQNLAYVLAREFNAPVHAQVDFTRFAAGVYWGLPANFVAVWSEVPGPGANETAYSAARTYINRSFPPEGQAWAVAYLDTFYDVWQASFWDPNLSALRPLERAEFVIAQALPGFLASPIGVALFPDPAQRMFQLGMLGVFNLTNFAENAIITEYGLSLFVTVPAARMPFFRDLLTALPSNATDTQIRAFAREEALAYDPTASPLVLPLNITRYYVSEDRRILLMNYGFTREASFTEGDGKQPVREDILVLRGLVSRIRQAHGAAGEIYVTGDAAASLDNERTFGGGAEFLVTIVLVIILIGLYFRSAVAPAFPILTIGVALLLANLFVYFVAVYLLTIDFTVTSILQTVLLAVGTDYSIFIVSRYRDERRDGRDRREAVRNAVIWAGESVATSGGAVLISFAALSLGSFPLLRTLGLTLGAAVTLALAIALTFIPAILMLLGNRVFWPSGKKATQRRPRDPNHWSPTERYFHGAATASMNHAKTIVLAALLITVPATYIVLTTPSTYDLTQGAPATESSRGLDAIGTSFGYGFLFPAYIVVEFPGDVLLPDGNVSGPALDALASLSDRILEKDSGVKSVEGPTNPQGSPLDYRNLSSMDPGSREALVAAMRPYIGRDNQTVRLVVVLADPPFSREALATIDRLRQMVPELAQSDPLLASSSMYVGGVTAVLNDVRHNLDEDLQVMAWVVTVGLFVVLLFVLGSVLIPLRAILTILLSISWTLALTILLFRSWMGLDPIFILPLTLFVMAMGLGMDYDIFIITRVREEVAKGKSDREAIAEATTRTGGIISACGIVMAGAFFTLMLNPSPFLREIGFALAFAILLDSMVVRIYLVPAIMVLAGKYNWWAPGPLQRVRRKEGPTEDRLKEIDEL